MASLGAGIGAGAGASAGSGSNYTRHPITQPPPDLPSLRTRKLNSGLQNTLPPDYVPSNVWAAAATGRWAYVVKELDNDPSLIHQADQYGQTLLHWAAIHGATVMLKRLIDMGSSINVLSGNGQTPFMWACIQGQLEAMDILRQQGVDMEVHDDNGATALLLSVQHKRPLAMLVLLDMGADVDGVDNEGCGVAHYAASLGNMDALRILKARDYPLNKLDNRGMSPLHRSARSDEGDVASFLIQHGNDPSLKAEGMTAAEMAKSLKKHYAAGKIAKAAAKAKGVRGNLWDQITAQVMSGRERDRWAWCAGWAVNFMGSAVVYYGNLLPVAASHTFLNMVFVLAMGTMMVLYPILTLGDPGRVSDKTPKHPGPRRQQGRGNGSHGDGDEEAGLVSNSSFVARLTEGIEGLANEARANYVCFTCNLVKPLRSKHCSTCDVCVDRMDHHCVWINNCVGSGNQRMFNIFCIAQSVAVTLFCIFCAKALYLLWGHSYSTIHFLRSLMFLYKLLLLHFTINAIGVFMTVTISYSQFVNMAKNITTNEEINLMRYDHFWREFQTEDGRRGKRFENPFAQDRVSNFLEYWGLKDAKLVTMQDIVEIVQENQALRDRDITLFGEEAISNAGLREPSAVATNGHAAGGGDHGHSHGGGGGGGHGHSHGGQPCHGH